MVRGNSELQLQYSNYKSTLQQLAQKIGDIEQETEEHKLESPTPSSNTYRTLSALAPVLPNITFFTTHTHVVILDLCSILWPLYPTIVNASG